MYEELIEALRFCAENSNGWNCPACPGFDGLCSAGKEIRATAADAIREQTAQLAAKDAEIGRLNIEFRYKQDECNYHYGAACEAKADLARVTAERDAAINEVCMKCKPSEIVEGLAFYDCEGCQWRTPAKEGEEG